MEIFDIIQTLVDLSNKGSEYNEEIGELNLKVSTLQATLLKLEKGRALDPIQIKHLKDLLNDGISLMQNVSKHTNLWRNIRNMFPGSELSQIKEINAKIEKAIQLVNLSINTHAAYKKRNYREIDSDSDSNCSSQNNQKQNKRKPKQHEGAMQAALIAETLNFDMIKPTIAMEDSKHEDQFPTGEAFSVKI